MTGPRHISAHISEQAKLFLLDAPDDKAPPTNIYDAEELAAGRKELHEMYFGMANADVQPYTLRDDTINGVSCLHIEGPHVEDEENVILHIHGGCYVFLEPRSSLAYSGQVGLLSKNAYCFTGLCPRARTPFSRRT